MQLSSLAASVGLQWQGQDFDIQDICIDSRAATPGCLFVALPGESSDGHDFVQDCEGLAAAAVVSRDVETTLPCLKVQDCLLFLQSLAAFWRRQHVLPVVAVTGSCGKTTTRALLESILGHVGLTHASIKSYNNHVGVPLTLLGLRANHEFCVAEVGTSGPGEISHLSGIVSPTVAVVTMAAPVHLQGLNSVFDIVREKGAIYESLPVGGKAIINADDPYAWQWLSMVPKGVAILQFSRQQQVDITATEVRVASDGHLQFLLTVAGHTAAVNCPLLGEHNVTNVLAAAAVASALGISLDDIIRGVNHVPVPERRLQALPGRNGSLIIDDTYNANPTAVTAAMNVLMSMPRQQHYMVLGDMFELGDEAALYHENMVRRARECGIDRLYAIGEHMQSAVQAFGEGGQYFATQEALIAELLPALHADVAICVKGSNGMNLNLVTAALQEVM